MTPNSEPVGWGAAVTALAVAGIPLLTAFGVAISQNQSSAILGFMSALVIFLGLFVRSKVTPVSKAESAVATALNTQPASVDTTQQSKDILAAAKTS